MKTLIRVLLLLCASSLVAGCAMKNTGLAGNSIIVFQTLAGDDEIRPNPTIQNAQDQNPGVNVADYLTSYTGARADGVAASTWSYVRVIEFNIADMATRPLSRILSEEVRQFFSTVSCSPDLTAQPSGGNLLRSGRLGTTGRARLVTTRARWVTEVGPGPNDFSNFRIRDADLTAYASTAELGERDLLAMDLQFLGKDTSGKEIFRYEQTGRGMKPDATIRDCQNMVLNAQPVSLPASNWLARGTTFNLFVKVSEKKQ